MAGKFFAIYGINNIGKTTHAKRLVEKLKKLGRDAVYLKYPIYGQKPTGPFLDKILRSGNKQKLSEEELQLWFVLNRYQYQPELKRMLEAGKIVIAEDYIGTGIAWGITKGASQSELENMNKFLVQADHGILIDGERVLTAKEKKHLHESDDSLVKNCRANFLQLAKKFRWDVVELAQDKAITEARIWEIVKKSLD